MFGKKIQSTPVITPPQQTLQQLAKAGELYRLLDPVKDKDLYWEHQDWRSVQ